MADQSDNSVTTKTPSAPDQAPVSTSETPNSIPSVDTPPLSSQPSAINTAAQNAPAGSTTVQPTSTGGMVPVTKPAAPANNGQPQWSPEQQALRDKHPVAAGPARRKGPASSKPTDSPHWLCVRSSRRTCRPWAWRIWRTCGPSVRRSRSRSSAVSTAVRMQVGARSRRRSRRPAWPRSS